MAGTLYLQRRNALYCALIASFLTLMSSARAGDVPRSTTVEKSRVSTPEERAPDIEPAPTLSPVPGQSSLPLAVTAATFTEDAGHTVLDLEFSRAVPTEIFTLANPYRVVIALPQATFRIPDAAKSQPQGLVSAFRFGLFTEDKARIVLDTRGPVRVESAALSGGKGETVRMSVRLMPTSARDFGDGTGALRAPPIAAEPGEAPPPARKKSGKFVVVIDPGHGGIDSGAVGISNLLEKTVVLAVGKQVASILAATGRYDVKLTRTTDVYVSLSERLKFSRQYGADIFISIHADSLETTDLTASIRGASIYTLSEKPSDEQARLRAERENASDLIAGLTASSEDEKDVVMGILQDFAKEETARFSLDLARLLVGKLTQTASMAREPLRSGAFRVLKQTHTPSVLIELGFLSHVEDEKLMTSAPWQNKVATSIATGVDAYFKKRAAASR